MQAKRGFAIRSLCSMQSAEGTHWFASMTWGADELAFYEEPPRRPAISDAEACMIAKREYGRRFTDEIVNMGKQRRDSALRRLYSMGITIRQMERITGIGRGIIQKAVSERKKM